MSTLKRISDIATGALFGAGVGGNVLKEAANELEITRSNLELAKEQASLADIELRMEDKDWIELTTGTGTWDFRRDAIKRSVALSRVMYLINPLIKRAVTLQELYVWGSGCSIEAEHKVVDEVIEDFFKDPKNQRVVGDSWPEREREQRIDGNTFFIFFRNPANGAARVRLLPLDEVNDIIFNPEDCKEPWFYKRAEREDLDTHVKSPELLYPDIDYNPKSKPNTVHGIRVEWDKPVMHIYTGGLSSMKFGIPELYAALAWARSYKRFLENFAKIIEAYGTMAMKMTNLTGKKGTAAAKSKLNTTLGGGSFKETNPPPQTGSWMLLQGGVDVSAIKTAGSTTAPDEARALRCMVAAGADMPEHFFGDSDVGNFATSTTLDRPTELKMIQRQNMWATVIIRICDKLVLWSALAPQGKLKRAGFSVRLMTDPFDGSRMMQVDVPKDGSAKIVVKFPSIVTRDVTDRVRAVVMAATLNGNKAEGIIPDRRIVFKLLMEALGEKDAARLTELLYPESVMQGFIDPADIMENERAEAQGKADLGKAAVKQADVAEKEANKPDPAPVPPKQPMPKPDVPDKKPNGSAV